MCLEKGAVASRIFIRKSDSSFLINFLLKMLIILSGVPVAAPGKAVLGKEAVAKIIFIDFISKALTAVSINFAAGRGNIVAPVGVFAKDHVGVIVGVDVNGETISMFGEVGRAVHYPIVETGSIVVCHGSGIIPVVLVDQTDAFEAIVILVKLVENFHHILCDGLVADQLTVLHMTVEVNVLNAHIMQVLIRDSTAVFGVRDACNPFFD